VVGIAHQMRLPIKFIGIGEKLDDLRPFHAANFVEAIFG
jgi:fused signal recognition particle receptor